MSESIWIAEKDNTRFFILVYCMCLAIENGDEIKLNTEYSKKIYNKALELMNEYADAETDI